MSLETTITRIGQIESMLDPMPATTQAPSQSSATTATNGTSSPSFADALLQASSAQSALGDSSGDDTSGADGTAGTTDLVNSLDDSLPGSASTLAAGATGLPTTATGLTPVGLTGTSLYPTAASGASGTGDPAMVNIAATQVGQAEQPDGSNNGPAISMYRTATAGAMAGEPWCAYFVSWVARQAGTPLGDQGQGFGSVSQIWSWAQEHGRAETNGPGVVPKPGDLIVFGGEHVGIVDRVLPNGDIETIEGNYSNKVSQVIRSPTEATGYVRMS